MRMLLERMAANRSSFETLSISPSNPEAGCQLPGAVRVGFKFDFRLGIADRDVCKRGGDHMESNSLLLDSRKLASGLQKRVHVLFHPLCGYPAIFKIRMGQDSLQEIDIGDNAMYYEIL